MVCDGSPQKLFLGLVGELVFCDICQVPVGDLDKHCQESHDGIIPEDKLQLELDHILPLCGPGHVEKNLMTTTVQIIWNLIGLDEFSKWCDYMGEGQKQYLYNCGDHHKTADFIIIYKREVLQLTLVYVNRKYKSCFYLYDQLITINRYDL